MAMSGEVLFEFRRIGALVKVTAFHVPSMTEISISGPANAGEAMLRTQALRRLEYVLAKKAAGNP